MIQQLIPMYLAGEMKTYIHSKIYICECYGSIINNSQKGLPWW